jgi:hypothetical protein
MNADDRQDREQTNQNAVIGHDQPEIPIEHALNNLGHAALFFAKDQ